MVSVLRAYALISVTMVVVAYAFASSSTTYLILLTGISAGLVAILSFLVSFSIGKYLVSCLVVVLRHLLRVPFRIVRAAPRIIRLCFLDAPVVVTFFLWYQVLVFIDRHVLRRLISTRHPSGAIVSTVNSMSPSFRPLSLSRSYEFDLKSALSLANLSKIAYEDEELIRYELEHAGYDMSSFKIIKYHNTSGFIAQYKKCAVISFRGTEPTNLMHILTDLKGSLTSIGSLDDANVNAGRVHYGFLEALRLHRQDQPKEEKEKFKLELDRDDSIGSVFAALFKIGGFLFSTTKSFAAKPVIAIPRSHGKITAFQQIHNALDTMDFERVYITGHSLGGALSTVFYAQCLLSSMSKVYVDRLQVYTFGAPRLGDARFREWIEEEGRSKNIFKIIHAQDLVPRQPTLPQNLPKILRHLPYADSPGTNIHLHPLEGNTFEETSGMTVTDHVPPIQFWSMTGILSTETTALIRSESWLWVAARIFIPFVMFDHLPGEYTRVMRAIWDKSDEANFERQIS